MVEQILGGVAPVNITPPVGGYLQGYTRGKRSIGIHREIYAKALVVDDGSTKAAIVTVDLIGLDQSTVASMRDEAARLTDIPPENVMVSASHSHAGPTTMQGADGNDWAVLWGNPSDLDYNRELVKKVGGAVAMAARDMRPVTVGFGVGEAHFNINRRLPTSEGTITAPNPDGVVDHRVKVVKLMDIEKRDATGTDSPEPPPLAVLFQFTCHPTIMAMENLEIGPDYPGVAQAFVEDAYGGGPTSGHGLPHGSGTVALFVQGCSGDIRPNLTTPDRTQFRSGTKRDAHRLGRILGAEVVKVCEEVEARSFSGPVRVASTRITLPYTKLPERRELEELIAKGGTMTHWGHLDTQGRMFGDAVWAELTLRRMKQGSVPNGVEIEMQALRIGELIIVGIPGEVFAEIGFQIEETISGPSLVLGYTNGNVGYLCTEAAYEGGGYEPSTSWMLYNHPAQFDPTNEHRIVNAGREISATLNGK